MPLYLTEAFIIRCLEQTFHPGALAWTDGYAELFGFEPDGSVAPSEAIWSIR